MKPDGSTPYVKGKGADDQGCVIGVTTIDHYPGPDPHFAALSAFCIVFIAVLTIWLWVKARRFGRNL